MTMLTMIPPYYDYVCCIYTFMIVQLMSVIRPHSAPAAGAAGSSLTWQWPCC